MDSRALRVGLVNPKGGCGKTTLAVHFARAVQDDGHAPVVIDTDPQGSAIDWRERSPTPYDGPPVVHETESTLLRENMRSITDGYDVAVLDGPAQLQAMTGTILSVSDVALIPIRPSALDLWGTAEFLDLLREEMRTSDLTVAFVVSQRDPRSTISEELEEAIAGWELPLLEGTCKRVAFARSMANGRTVLEGRDAKAKNEVMEILVDVAQLASK